MSLSALQRWFADLGWTPFPFQEEAWAAYLAGRSGLVHAPTGMGKTFAVWLGPVAEALAESPPRDGLQVLWITPLRALATDTAEALQAAVDGLGLPWKVEKRTGDTSSSVKARQRERLPSVLVTTPESLSLLLTHHALQPALSGLRAVIVDEWHELLGTKRGVMTELCLARLRAWNPALPTWGLSATLGNLPEAMQVLLGTGPHAQEPVLVRGSAPKRLEVRTLLPATLERFPWGGHLGTSLVGPVLEEVAAAGTTLLFTNTRSQAELWFQSILEARPDWEPALALHHGSLDREHRDAVEDGLRSGALRCVVSTSSLDLGVDFSPVDLVVQVGSPKGIARLLQRAGRSGHRPGAPSRLLCVPTNAFELVEFAAARLALEERDVEGRAPLEKPLDLLVQHLVTVALGGGFDAEAMLREVRSTHAFRRLTDEEWAWALDFISRGGPALRAYPHYARVQEHRGTWKAVSEVVGRVHRTAIGTITSDAAIAVRYRAGATLGTVEESFVSRLKPGDRFLFGGRVVELLQVRDLTATVRRASGAATQVPRWMGGRMPLSSLLARHVRRRLDEARQGHFQGPEMAAARPLLERQAADSLLPGPEELLIEAIRTREGHHLFVYPFAGRLVHEGLSALVAYRIARETPSSLTAVVNDAGFELLSARAVLPTEEQWRRFLSPERLLEDLHECLNATEMARRRFRDVARVAGLVQSGLPGQRKSTRQLQASSGLLFDVFAQFDPGNLLLHQARREVLEGQLEVGRLRETLAELAGHRLLLRTPARLTPLAFPLWAERLREHISTEKWIDRVRQMIEDLEREPAPRR